MQLRVGRLTKPHGLKGGLRVEMFTDEPDKRFVKGAVMALKVPEDSPWFGKSLTLRELRWYNNVHPVAFFDEVPDRTAAESVTKAMLYIEHDPSELPDEPDAWYDHQLVGLDVKYHEHKVGKVLRVDHFPAQDLLAIRSFLGNEHEVLLPFVSAIVPEVNLADGYIVITPPAGLLDPDDAELASDSDDPSMRHANRKRSGGAEEGMSDAEIEAFLKDIGNSTDTDTTDVTFEHDSDDESF